MELTTILCILLLSLYLLLAVFWIVRSVIDAIDDHERKKRNDALDAEKQRLEKERALREVEYHEARMKKSARVKRNTPWAAERSAALLG